MPDSRRRIIVDGLEPGALVRFPLILRSVASAFQPPRLVVALVVVLALVLPGRAWDAVRGPRLAPTELLGGAGEEQAERETEVRAAIRARWAPLAEVPPVDVDDAAAVDEAVVAAIELLDRSYRRWREMGDVPEAAEAAEPDAVAGAVADGRPRAGGSPGGAVRPSTPDDRSAEPAAERSMTRYHADRAALLAQRRAGEFEACERAVHASVRSVAAGLLSLDPAMAWAGTRRLFVDLPIGAWTHAPLLAAAYTPLLLAVWALGGGALSRMAATFIGRSERATVFSAVRFARGAWLSLILAPLVPLVAAAAALVPAVLVGLLLLVPGLDVVGGVLYGLVVIAGVFAAVLLVGVGAGAPLVAAVIAAERCDAIDAAQRPYAFLLRRPAHLAGYLALAVVAAALTYIIAGGIASVALDLTAHAASLGGRSAATVGADGPPLFGPAPFIAPPAEAGVTSRVTGLIIGLWRELLLLLVAAAVISTWASATTAAYLLLRQVVDGQDPEEIWEEGMVPGTFARRAPTRPNDHGVAPRRPGRAATGGEAGGEAVGEAAGEAGARAEGRNPDAASVVAATDPGVPEAVAVAAREEEEAETSAGERVAGADLSAILAEPDAPPPPPEELDEPSSPADGRDTAAPDAGSGEPAERAADAAADAEDDRRA